MADSPDPRIGGWTTWCKMGLGKTKGDKKPAYNFSWAPVWYYAEELAGVVVPISDPIKK